MKQIILLSLLAFAFSCSHSQRDPASVKHDQETVHQKFQGTFDRPSY